MTDREKKQMSRLFNEDRYSFAELGRLYGLSRERARIIVHGDNKDNYLLPSILVNRGICTMCLYKGITDIHYIDGNVDNTSPRNLIALCDFCIKNTKKRMKNKPTQFQF